jgi:hypothetical protein
MKSLKSFLSSGEESNGEAKEQIADLLRVVTKKNQPLLSSKRMPQFKTQTWSWNEKIIWSWFLTWPDTEYDCAG